METRDIGPFPVGTIITDKEFYDKWERLNNDEWKLLDKGGLNLLDEEKVKTDELISHESDWIVELPKENLFNKIYQRLK